MIEHGTAIDVFACSATAYIQPHCKAISACAKGCMQQRPAEASAVMQIVWIKSINFASILHSCWYLGQAEHGPNCPRTFVYQPALDEAVKPPHIAKATEPSRNKHENLDAHIRSSCMCAQFESAGTIHAGWLDT